MDMTNIVNRLGVSRRHMYRLLSGEQNASPNLAKAIERKTGMPKELFVFGTSSERRAEWKRYLRTLKAEEKQQ